MVFKMAGSVYCIGVDEAGYGPRLGPLVISASLWQLPAHLPPEQMYQHLCQVITPKPSRRKKPERCTPPDASLLSFAGQSGLRSRPAERGLPCHLSANNNPGHFPTENGGPLVPTTLLPKILQELPLVVADSKLVYSRLGRAGLERTVFVLLAAAGRRPARWSDLVDEVAFDPESRHDALAWYPQYWPSLPESLSAAEMALLAERVAQTMAEQGIRLLGLRSILLFPERFNRLVGQYGNKATMLSCQSLELVKGLLAELPTGAVLVLCDKHGSRDKYQELLSKMFAPEFFPPAQVKAVQEGRTQSIYQLQTAPGPVEFRFVCGGEILMPIALASMLSKYLRELAMEAWNRFWAEQVPGICPTAGYPKDACRFRAEIALRQAALGIPDSAIWRTR